MKAFKEFCIIAMVIILSASALTTIPYLWEAANEAKTSHMSQFWFGLIFFNLLQGAFVGYVIISVIGDKLKRIKKKGLK